MDNTAKAIADKVDYGAILLPVKEDDIKALESVLATGLFDTPNLKMSVYKNRRGRYKSIILWCKAELGKCRIEPKFCTTYDYELLEIKDIELKYEPKNKEEI